MSAEMKQRRFLPPWYIAMLGLASLFAIFTREAGALPMDHPNFGYCSDLSRRANVGACPGVGTPRRGAAGGAAGGQMTAMQRACRNDYFAFCKGVPRGGGKRIACLSQHSDKLSAACRTAIGTGGEEPAGY